MPHRCHIDAASLHMDATSTPHRFLPFHFFALLGHLEPFIPLHLFLLILHFPWALLGPFWSYFPFTLPLFHLIFHFFFHIKLDPPSIHIDATSMPHRCHIDARLMPHRCHIDPHRCHVDATSMPHRSTSMPYRCHIDATSIHIDATSSHVDATSIPSISFSFFAPLGPLEGSLWSCLVFTFALTWFLLIFLFLFIYILGPPSIQIDATSMKHRCHIDATSMPHRCDIDPHRCHIDATSMPHRSASMPHRCQIDATSIHFHFPFIFCARWAHLDALGPSLFLFSFLLYFCFI